MCLLTILFQEMHVTITKETLGVRTPTLTEHLATETRDKFETGEDFMPSVNTNDEKESDRGQEVSYQRHNMKLFSCVAKLEYIISVVAGSNDIVKTVRENSALNARDILVEIQSTSSSVFELCKELTVDCTEELLNISATSGVVVENHSDDSESVVHKDPGIRKPISSENQRKYLISCGPNQPKLSVFPADPSISKKKQCRFHPGWYEDYQFLEYSIEKDAAFCFVCSLFPSGPGRDQSENAWVEDGVRQWHKMKSQGKAKKGKLASHFSSGSHKAALSDYCHFVSSNGHVDFLLDKRTRAKLLQQAKDEETNRKIVTILLDVARTLARQGIAFRRTEEQDGNFVQFVQLLARYVPALEAWLNDSRYRPYKVTYLHKMSQNEFIELLSAEVREKILDEVLDSEFYSVMADTTPDASHSDKLAVVIRTISSEGMPRERLLDVSEANDKTGQGMAESIIGTLTRRGIPLDKLAFQSYDYASAMSGQFNGAQQKVSELLSRRVPYIPCQAHRLNTVIEHSCNSSLLIAELFNILEEMYVFFSSSTKRFAALKEKLSSIENSLNLRNLSRTRWTARAETIQAVVTSFEAIVSALDEIKQMKNADTKTKAQASGLLKRILNFDFIACLMFMKNIMYKARIATEKLEEEEMNIIDAIEMLDATKKLFERISCEEMNSLIDSAAQFAKRMEVDPEADFIRHHRRRLGPSRYDSRAQSQADISMHQFYRQHFRILLDKLTTMMGDNLRACLADFLPFCTLLQPPLNKSISVADIEQATKFFPNQERAPDATALQVELEVLFQFCQGAACFREVLGEGHRRNRQLKQASRLCKLAATAPVAVAAAERTFSKLKFVKNWLRTAMLDSRLDSLMLLASEKDLTDGVDLNKIVQRWSILKKRRIQI